MFEGNAVCEAKRVAGICEVSKKNAELIMDINAGMDTLLELLVGPANCGDNRVEKGPDCLGADVARQAEMLGEMHAKLSRAISALNG